MKMENEIFKLSLDDLDISGFLLPTIFLKLGYDVYIIAKFIW